MKKLIVIAMLLMASVAWGEENKNPLNDLFSTIKEINEQVKPKCHWEVKVWIFEKEDCREITALPEGWEILGEPYFRKVWLKRKVCK